jgi:protoporphyrinogen oxidase
MKKRVIIIGGGIAGLAAAARLATDCEVTLLEARARFGGRVFTENHNGHVVELGAEFIHGENRELIQAIDEAGLDITDVSEQNRVWEKGKLESMDIWDLFGELTKKIETQTPDQSFLSFLD